MTEQAPRPTKLVSWRLEHQGKRYNGELEQLTDSKSLTIEQFDKEGKLTGRLQIMQPGLGNRGFSPLLDEITGFIRSVGQ